VNYHRRVIKIKAEDSPNVRLALMQQARGEVPTGEVICPGVLTWEEYKMRRATWDRVRQCIGLDGEFYEGSELLLFPPDWRTQSEINFRGLVGRKRVAKGMGIDPGEGGANSSWWVVDELGVIDWLNMLTADTSVVPDNTIMMMRKHSLSDDRVCFDRGGGGKQHADTLRSKGYKGIRTVAFGEALLLPPQRHKRLFEDKKEYAEEKYVYVNRRAEMYFELSMLLDPVCPPMLIDGKEDVRFSTRNVFGVPSDADSRSDLQHQLSVMPKLTDKEGRYWMLPKTNPKDDDDQRTLVKLIGHSPDEADALVLAVHAMLHKSSKVKAGAAQVQMVR
jgi:hypothetical protein